MPDKDNDPQVDAYYVLVVIESSHSRFNQMWHWSIKMLKGALEGSRYGPIILKFYDRNWNEIGKNIIGSPSPEAVRLAEEEDEEPHQVPPTPLATARRK